MSKPSPSETKPTVAARPSREQAEEAVRTLLAWAGDDPARAGLANTPRRVTDAFSELFSGYACDPAAELARTFEDVSGYSDMILLRDVRLESHCEHHLAPFSGLAHVAYLPDRRVVGLSRMARIVDIFARRLQVQESLTAQIAETIQQALQPQGAAVMILARHKCMAFHDTNQPDAIMETTHFTGVFNEDAHWRQRFIDAVRTPARL